MGPWARAAARQRSCQIPARSSSVAHRPDATPAETSTTVIKKGGGSGLGATRRQRSALGAGDSDAGRWAGTEPSLRSAGPLCGSPTESPLRHGPNSISVSCLNCAESTIHHWSDSGCPDDPRNGRQFCGGVGGWAGLLGCSQAHSFVPKVARREGGSSQVHVLFRQQLGLCCGQWLR
jgi:hypothetical protein